MLYDASVQIVTESRIRYDGVIVNLAPHNQIKFDG